MAQPKFTLYKYVKLQGGWRYCKAAFHDKSKIKPNVVIVGKDKHEEKRPEGSYYLAHAGQWIPVGDAMKVERRRRESVAGGIPAAQRNGDRAFIGSFDAVLVLALFWV